MTSSISEMQNGNSNGMGRLINMKNKVFSQNKGWGMQTGIAHGNGI